MARKPLPLPKDMKEIESVLSMKGFDPNTKRHLPTELYLRLLELQVQNIKSGHYETEEGKRSWEKWKMCGCEKPCSCYMKVLREVI